MNTKIKNLITKKNYFEALLNINQELSKRYDLSNARSRKIFSELHELKDKLQQKILISANQPKAKKSVKGRSNNSKGNTSNSIWRHFNSIGIMATPYSLGGSSRSPKSGKSFDAQKIINDLNKRDMFSAYSEQIKAIVEENGLKGSSNLLINIMITPDVPNELLKEGEHEKWEMQLREKGTGEYIPLFHGDLNVPKSQHLICFNNRQSLPMDMVLKGFRSLVEMVYKERYRKVSVIFSNESENDLFNVMRIFYYLILLQLFYQMYRNGKNGFAPLFYFIFKNSEDKHTFESIKDKIIRPEDRPVKVQGDKKDRNSRLEALVEKALTKNPKYIEQLKAIINVIDEEDVPLLILGESGVGKSFITNIIHKESIRGKEPFQEVNCGAFSESLLNSTLFGYLKGAFTGADKDTEGIIAAAEKGTLFLDEIDRASQSTRNKLLTFIETKKYNILNDPKKSEADVRLVFGTNKDLKTLVRKGKFEEDFYYRITDRVIEIPPLRERKEDIELLVKSFLEDLNKKKGVRVEISKDAINYLKTYYWPGNVRELKQYIRNQYFDCIADEEDLITLEQLKNAPFNTLSKTRGNDYEELLSNLKNLLTTWDAAEGNFKDEIILPVLAKIYIEDLLQDLKKTEKSKKASGFIGMDDTQVNSSTLRKYYGKFPEVRKKLGL